MIVYLREAVLLALDELALHVPGQRHPHHAPLLVSEVLPCSLPVHENCRIAVAVVSVFLVAATPRAPSWQARQKAGALSPCGCSFTVLSGHGEDLQPKAAFSPLGRGGGRITLLLLVRCKNAAQAERTRLSTGRVRGLSGKFRHG